MVKGSCLCGGVHYEIDGEVSLMANCHCSMCRKHHGAAFATYVGVDTADFRWVKGEDLVARYRSSPGLERGFCRTGGSNLFIGSVFLLVALLFGAETLAIIHLLPMSALGVLLIFAGAQLGLTILDILNRRELFVILLIVGITLASNLAAGFIVGILIERLLRWQRFSV